MTFSMYEKDYLYLLALLCAIPGAWLSFRKAFIRDFESQMVDRENQGGVGTKTITFLYKVLAHLMIGPKEKWLDLFDPTARARVLKEDKTSALRIFMWFALMFICSFLRWYLDRG